MKNEGALLADLTVLDLTDAKGQLTGKILADLGATVVKIEPMIGDVVRRYSPFVDDTPGIEKSIPWLALNAGKKSLTLDIGNRDDRLRFRQLAIRADMVLETFAPGFLKSHGLDFQALSEENPGLIMVSITPFGSEGPYCQFQGSDLICMALSGIMNLTGENNKHPIRIGVPQAYAHASLEAAVGALFALYHRHQSGRGSLVDVSVQEALLSEGGFTQAVWYMNRQNITRQGTYGSFSEVVPMRTVHSCKDGYVLMYLVGGPVFAPGMRALIDWMASEGMADQELINFRWESYYATAINEETNRKHEPLFERFFRTKTKKELWDRALADNMLLAPVCAIRDVAESEIFKKSNFWINIYHPELGRNALYPGAPYQSNIPNYHVRGVAPRLGQDNDLFTTEVMAQPARAGNSCGRSESGSTDDKDRLLFENLKILDLSWVATGPSAVRYLADYGAQVIRVESATRPDTLRLTRPFKDGKPDPNGAAYFAIYNSNKYGITLDLKNPGSRELIQKLVAWADVVVESFSPGIIEKLGLGYEELKKIKHDIIMASSSMFGQNGPRFRGFGAHAAALGGFWSVTGYPGGEPSGLYGAYCDYVANRYLIIALLMALEEKRQTGRGQHIDQSQIESSLTFLSPAILDYRFNQREPSRKGNLHDFAAPHNAYPCKGENRWCAIAVFNQRQWDKLKMCMGSPQWADDPAFGSSSSRKNNEVQLDKQMGLWTIQYDAYELMNLLQEKGIPAGMVSNAEDLHNDPQLKYRKHYQYVEHPVMKSYAHETAAFRIGGIRPREPMSSPCIGQHNEYVTTRLLGFTKEEFLKLMDSGAFGWPAKRRHEI